MNDETLIVNLSSLSDIIHQLYYRLGTKIYELFFNVRSLCSHFICIDGDFHMETVQKIRI